MKVILYGTLVLALLSACSREPESNTVEFDIDAGKAIAESECIDCHGMARKVDYLMGTELR